MYGVLSKIQAPVEAYDAVHAEVRRIAGDAPDGLLTHVGRATADGFEVLEVWQSREQFERFQREVMPRVMAVVMPGAPPPPPDAISEVDVRGLVVPSAGIYR